MPLFVGYSVLSRFVPCRHRPFPRHFLATLHSTAPFSSRCLAQPVLLQHCNALVTNSHRQRRGAAFASQSAPPVPSGKHTPNETDGVGWYQRYEQWLQSGYPNLYKMHRLTVDGSKWCYSDLKTYFWLAHGLRKGRITLNDLNARELFIYIQAGSQLVKLSVLAMLAVLPAGFPLIVVSMLASPKLVLTRHFWTDWQSQQFQTEDLRRNERALFPRLVEALRQHNPSTLSETLDKQLPLTLDQLMSAQKSMRIVPTELETYTQQHRFYLKRMHKLAFWATDSALLRHIKLLQLLDARMATDHNTTVAQTVDALSVRDLQTHLYLRNINFARMTVDQMRSSLVQWLDHFKNPSTFDPLLYAHVPVLTQANSADLDRWRRKKTEGTKTAQSDGGTAMPSTEQKQHNFLGLPPMDNLEEWKRMMAQRSTELAKRSADAMGPILRKSTEMAAERLKEAGRAVKKRASN